MPTTTLKIGSSVREHRSASNLTCEQLASLVGCDANTIGRIERGEGDPSVRILKRLSEIFGLSIDEMMHTSQPTFLAEMQRCVKMLERLHYQYLKEMLDIIARSAKNDEVALFFSELDRRIKGDDFQEVLKKWNMWSEEASLIKERQNSLGNSEEKTKQEIERLMDIHRKNLPVENPPLSDNLKKLLDEAQQIVISEIFSPHNYQRTGLHRLYEQLKESFLPILGA